MKNNKFMSKDIGPVLITGSDTGIGRLTVDTLASKGYRIYAGAYNEDNIERLNRIPNVKAIKLDVTNVVEIENLVVWIEAQGEGLHGLVNNAGVGEIWPLIESSEERIHRVLNINLYGVIRVTTALVPFLLESKGRILSIGSLSGTIPTRMIGAYSISKFGVEAYADVLAYETKHLGIRSITIKPGNVQSNITKANASILEKRRDELELSRYKEELTPLFENLSNPNFLNRSREDAPDNVITAIEDALYSEKPKAKYLVTNEKDTFSAISWSMRVIGQLLERHPHKIPRGELHQMLDTQLDKFE